MKCKYILLAGFLFVSHTLAAYARQEQLSISIAVESRDYNYYNECTSRYSAIVEGNGRTMLRTAHGNWAIEVEEDNQLSERYYQVRFILKEGKEPSANVSVDLHVGNWSRDNYVLLPGAAYRGNRFESRKIAYSPKLLDPKDIGPDKPVIISDVPRLNITDGPSAINERIGAMALPSIGFWDSQRKESVILLAAQANECGDLGMSITENRSRNQAVISLKSPVMRERYRLGDAASVDCPKDFTAGDTVTFSFKLFKSPSPTLQGLFDRYLAMREDSLLPRSLHPTYPYSYCFSTLERKFNEQNFVKEWGYYAVGMRENYFQDWQIGWTGGMISTYPLLMKGNEETVSNVVANFDWLFKGGLAPCGLFWDAGEKGNIWYGGDIRKPHTANWHLIRKSGDGLFFILRQFDLFQKRGMTIHHEWESGLQRVADALKQIWIENGQFGQFVDNVTAKIQVGGSTSGAIIPGAMALASRYFGRDDYMEVAKASAIYYYEKYISQGITCGGPGDALQNPDSESSYAMLESFVTLYELTGESRWLEYAEEMAAQYSTWVFGYDYQFPASSTFGKLQIHASGSVLANTQNKHAGPGICTHSGAALFRLYRMTGNEAYLRLLRSTAYHLPQYLSTTERPVGPLPCGWMNERVNTTDWEGDARIGEVFRGSTWAETSLLLTIAEIPGIYVDVPKKMAFSFDNLKVRYLRDTSDGCVVEVYNPTGYDASFTCFVDGAEKNVLPMNYLFKAKELKIKSKQRKQFRLPLYHPVTKK